MVNNLKVLEYIFKEDICIYTLHTLSTGMASGRFLPCPDFINNTLLRMNNLY